MKRVNQYKKWAAARLSRELVKALRRATMLGEEIDRRAKEEERFNREAERAVGERVAAGDQETSFRLAHRGRIVKS